MDQYNHKVSLNLEELGDGVRIREDVRKKASLEWCNVKTQPTTAGFEDETRPKAKECRQPLESGKGKDTDSLPEPSKRI